jgi:transcription elongation factor GreA
MEPVSPIKESELVHMNDTSVQTTIKKVQLTADGLEELKAELEELRTTKLPQVIDRVAAARAHGDLSENAEYSDAKEEQSFTETRISEIEDILERAEVVQQTSSHTQVGIGSIVKIHLEKNPKKSMTYHIVGEFESSPTDGKISSASPLGKALLGKKKGDKAMVAAPAGEVTYIVDEIK